MLLTNETNFKVPDRITGKTTGVSFTPLCLIVWQEREIVFGHCILARENASGFTVGSTKLKE